MKEGKGTSGVKQITRAAVFCALLVVAQIATAPFGNSLVTGSLVNLILIMAVMTCGLVPGIAAAVVSPFAAKLFGGIGPLWSLLPFIALGNAVIVIVWRFTGEKWRGALAVVLGAAAKCLVLYLGVVVIALPLLSLPEPQRIALSAMFSLSQLYTAIIGGALAAFVFLPAVKRALRRGNEE